MHHTLRRENAYSYAILNILGRQVGLLVRANHEFYIYEGGKPISGKGYPDREKALEAFNERRMALAHTPLPYGWEGDFEEQ